MSVGRVKGALATTVSDYEDRASRYWKMDVIEVSGGTRGAGKDQAGRVREAEADRLAREALTRVEEAQTQHAQSSAQAQAQRDTATRLQTQVNDLKSKIASYENDLVTLKARTKTANATRKINQHLANVDSKGTVAMLERMKEKVEEQEALAEAYGEMGDATTSVDDEINKALADSKGVAVDDSLAQLKARMNAEKK